MSFFGKLLGSDKAIDGINDIASTGMRMWDKSEFTAQEKTESLLKLIEASKSKETSISRRIMAWAILAVVIITFALCVSLLFHDQKEMVKSIVELVKVFWIGEAFVTSWGFYFLTHVLGGKK